MEIDFTQGKSLTIPEGEVTKITDANGNILSDIVAFYQYDEDDIIQLPINWEIKNNNISAVYMWKRTN